MQQTEDLIKDANAVAPVGGIFHLAMVSFLVGGLDGAEGERI